MSTKHDVLSVLVDGGVCNGRCKHRHISVLSISEGGQSMLSQLKILFFFFMKPLMRIGLFHDPEKDTPKVQSL